MINDILSKSNLFFVIATNNITSKDLKIDLESMRPESLAIVRKQRNLNQKMKPIVVEIYPNEKPILADGRHRLQIAKERGDKNIETIIRYYDNDGEIISEDLRFIDI